jgi:hypothetical protein
MKEWSVKAIIANTMFLGCMFSTSDVFASETKLRGVLLGIEGFSRGIQVDMELMSPQEKSLSEILTEKTRATNVDGGEKPYFCNTALFSENNDAYLSLTDLSNGNLISKVMLPAVYVQTLRSKTQTNSLCLPHVYPTILQGLSLPGLDSLKVESAKVYVGPDGGILLPNGKFLNYAIYGEAAWEQQLLGDTEVQYQTKSFELHSLVFRAALYRASFSPKAESPGGKEVPVQYLGEAVSLIP